MRFQREAARIVRKGVRITRERERGYREREVVPGFRVKYGLSCVIGPLGRLGAATTLGQHCPQMTQRRCTRGVHY